MGNMKKFKVFNNEKYKLLNNYDNTNSLETNNKKKAKKKTSYEKLSIKKQAIKKKAMEKQAIKKKAMKKKAMKKKAMKKEKNSTLLNNQFDTLMFRKNKSAPSGYNSGNSFNLTRDLDFKNNYSRFAMKN